MYNYDQVNLTCPGAVWSVNCGSLFGSVQPQDAVYSEERMATLMRAHTRHVSKKDRKKGLGGKKDLRAL